MMLESLKVMAKLFSSSRLMKWLWSQEGIWCTGHVNSPYGVGVWRSIRSHWDTLLKNSNITGLGVKDLFPDLFNISTSPNAYLSTAKELQAWSITLRRILNDWEIQGAVEKGLITTKSKGGLGIKDLNAQNTSRLMKWLWSQEGIWCTGPVNSPYGVGNSNIQVGIGRTTLFWEDNWLGHECVKDLFPDLFNRSTSPNVYIATAKELRAWSITLRRILNDWEIKEQSSSLRLWKSFRGNQKQRTNCIGIHAKMGLSQSTLPIKQSATMLIRLLIGHGIL
ncbi:hypothetical protein H5410_024609 [Solanum commersonii]|uniref:Uncharacterized protein n=1 Tax=Solanum commersonii TaxID=4109 RepID=A0A9J5ZMH9_SOLCO|nr:hypothetical protein H5410_024609 [Solanum commersonii]